MIEMVSAISLAGFCSRLHGLEIAHVDECCLTAAAQLAGQELRCPAVRLELASTRSPCAACHLCGRIAAMPELQIPLRPA